MQFCIWSFFSPEIVLQSVPEKSYHSTWKCSTIEIDNKHQSWCKILNILAYSAFHLVIFVHSVYSFPLYEMVRAISLMLSCSSSPSMHQCQCYHPFYHNMLSWNQAHGLIYCIWTVISSRHCQSQWSPVINKIVFTPRPRLSLGYNRFTMLV